MLDYVDYHILNYYIGLPKSDGKFPYKQQLTRGETYRKQKRSMQRLGPHENRSQGGVMQPQAKDA